MTFKLKCCLKKKVKVDLLTGRIRDNSTRIHNPDLLEPWDYHGVSLREPPWFLTLVEASLGADQVEVVQDHGAVLIADHLCR